MIIHLNKAIVKILLLSVRTAVSVNTSFVCTLLAKGLFWMLTELVRYVRSAVSELYRASGCTVCQRVCSSCRLHMSLQWARPASAASAPIRTRPRTLPLERTWFCHTKEEQEYKNPQGSHNTNKCSLFFGCEAPKLLFFFYLHDYELEHEVQLPDVSWR